MPPVHFVYFDLDDTLLDHRHAERHALGDVHARYRDQLAGVTLVHLQETYHQHNVELWHRYAHEEITKDELKVLRFGETLGALGADQTLADEMNVFYMEHYRHHWCLIEGAQAAFHAIADQYPVGIITNGFGETQHAKLERFSDIRDRSEAIVISDEVGVMKPHARLFTHAQQAAATAPESILYVGDSYRSDVQGALNAGWQIAWFTKEQAAEKDVFCFQDWAALCVHLGVPAPEAA